MSQIVPDSFDISRVLDLTTNKEKTVLIFRRGAKSWSFVVDQDLLDIGVGLLARRLSPDDSAESVNRTQDRIVYLLTQEID